MSDRNYSFCVIQVLLRAYLGFSYYDFSDILKHIASKRMVTNSSSCNLDNENKHHIFDLRRISLVVSAMLEDESVQRLELLISDLSSLLDDITKYLKSHN